MVGTEEARMNGQQYAEALSRCAGKCTLPAPHTGGGDYTCHDLLMALAKADVPDLARILVRWRYLDDPGEREATLGALQARFRLPETLLGAAIWEWLAPAICLTCCGGQAAYAHLDACPACHGSGVPARRYGAPVGFSAEDWPAWEHDYQQTLDDLRDLTRMACVRAAALLTEPEVTDFTTL